MATAQWAGIEYAEAEPRVEWIDAENVQVIVPGFKREEMRVQVTSAGKLTVSGQRTVEGSKTSRFEKELQIPNDCDVTGITAKYENETLQIRLPKTKSPAPPKADVHSHKPLPQPQPQPHQVHPEKHHQDDTFKSPAAVKENAGQELREAQVTKRDRIGADGRAGVEAEMRKSKVMMVLLVIGALVVGYFTGRLEQAVKDGWKIVKSHS